MPLRVGCMAAVLTALALSGADAAGGAKEELARFQGEWLIHKELSRGADSTPKGGKVVVQGPTLKVYQGVKLAQTLTFRIDPAKDPKEIDLTQPGSKRTWPGIYRFDGDLLSIATGFGKKERATRPKSFEDKAGLLILILKRAKAK